METLLRLGLQPENAFILGKAYSSNGEVADGLRARGLAIDTGSFPKRPGGFQDTFRGDVEQLWSRALNRLRAANCSDVVILDDGGRCISMVPDDVLRLARVSGVEQTTSGVAGDSKSRGFRVVEVATSASKRLLESPMIGRAVLKRLPRPVGAARFGVIGIGNIGRCVATHLLTNGHRVLLFDRDPSRLAGFPARGLTDSLADLVRNSEIICGCTGDDVFAQTPMIEWRDGETTLISCSSEDREFRSLLASAAHSNTLEGWTPVGTGLVRTGAAAVRILRGGFPLNFDGSLESVPAREIQLTRALLLGGVLQSVLCSDHAQHDGRDGRMLDPQFQATVAREWFRVTPEHRRDSRLGDADRSAMEGLMAEHSGGEFEDTTALRSALDLG